MFHSTASEDCKTLPGNTSESWETVFHIHLWPPHRFLLIFYLAPIFSNNGTTGNLEAAIIFSLVKLTCAWFFCKFIIPFWQTFLSVLSRNTDHITDYKWRLMLPHNLTFYINHPNQFLFELVHNFHMYCFILISQVNASKPEKKKKIKKVEAYIQNLWPLCSVSLSTTGILRYICTTK